MVHNARVVAAAIPGVYTTETRSSQRFEKHWHDVFGFGLLQHGAQAWASGRGQVEACAGHVICTNPGEVHDGRPLGGAPRQWRIVSIDVATMARLVDLPAGRFEIARPVIQDAVLERAVRRLFDAVDAGDSGACDEALTESCRRLISRYGNHPVVESEPRADLRKVRDRLADVRAPVPSLDDLAVLAALNRFQVLRQFRRQYGLTPHAWLLQLRAERARSLIRAGGTLAEVAAVAGFADQSHMTRVFVRRYGYTPGAWKRAMSAFDHGSARHHEERRRERTRIN
jgi:AraC-like DNA-binding protein